MNFDPVISGPLFIRDAQDVNLVATDATPVNVTVAVGSSSWTVPVTPALSGSRYIAPLRLREILSAVVSMPGISAPGVRAVPLVTISAGNASMSFRAADGGATGKTPAQLVGHWLTWRDQVSKTYTWGRENLTFLAGLDLLGYTSGTYTVSAKVYRQGADPTTVTLASGSLQAGAQYITVDASYSRIRTLVSSGTILAWDVSYSFSGEGGSAVSGYPLRLIVSRSDVRVKEFVFSNSFGVEDRVYSCGRVNPKLDGTAVSFLSGAQERELRNDAEERREVFSGYLSTARESALWMDFLKSYDRYILVGTDLEQIVVDSQDTDMQDNAIGSTKFTYHLSKIDPGRFFQESDGLGDYDPTQQYGALYVGEGPPSEDPPAEDLFFLKTRLSEFPQTALSEDLLFLVQNAQTNAWGNLTVSSLKEYLQQVITREDVHIWTGPWNRYSAAVAGYGLSASLGKDLYDRVVALETSPSYHLPVASDTVLGGIKVGTGLEIDEEGVLSADATTHPYISLERLRHYLYRVTFDSLPEDDGGDNPVITGCSSYVKGGKLYRNLDFNYDEAASFNIRTRDFEGMSFITGLEDGDMDDELIAQLPYRIVDGQNNYGISISTHVLFNDWSWTGAGQRSISLTRLPFLVLSQVKSMATIAQDLSGVLNNLYASEALLATGYILQLLVTDGTTTYAILPPTAANQAYVLQDISSNPKMANFRWVNRATVVRTESDIQARPNGIERFNAMPCPLEDLRFTKAYEQPTRLSEFIGIDRTTKNSTDAELTTIYNRAHTAYLDRSRDGQTWQTMHSVVYGQGIESLYIQENWEDNCEGLVFSQLPDIYVAGTKAKGSASDEELKRITKISFVAAAAAGEDVDLEVVTINGVRYLHTSLPFYSDDEITAGAAGHSGQGGGGLAAVYFNNERADDGTQAKFGIKINGSWATVETDSTYGKFININTTAGAVTQIKVGTTAYNPVSGVVSLPAYPDVTDMATRTFVNSSIATATATFRGTSAAGLTEAQFLAWANGLTHDNNDYVFWNTTDSDGNVQFKRYKFNGTSWVYEYTLNNSSFTASQWGAINSGITTGKVTQYDDAYAHSQASDNPHGTTFAQLLGSLAFSQLPDIYIAGTKAKGSASDEELKRITKISFVAAAAAGEDVDLEVVTINGVRYLHTSLPFYSDDEITAGAAGHSGQGGGGLVAVYFNNERADDGTQAKFGIKINGSWATVETDSTYGKFININTTAGAVTQIKVGTTAYNPVSGVVSLPAYPDVSDMATRTWVGQQGFLTSRGYIGTTAVQSSSANQALNGISSLALTGGRVLNSGDDEGIVIAPATNGWAGVCLGDPTGARSVFYYNTSSGALWRYHNGTNFFNIYHPSKSGTIALTSDIPTALSQLTDDVVSGHYLPLTGGTMTGEIILGTNRAIIGVNEAAGGMIFFDGTRTVVGSIGPSTTGNTRIRSLGSVERYNGTTAYTIYDSGNCNLSTVNWACNELFAHDGAAITEFSPIRFRNTNSNNYTNLRYDTKGNEALVLAMKNSVTSFIVKSGDSGATADSNTSWTSLTPSIQVKGQSLYVNSLIANDVTPSYNFLVNGTSYLGGAVTTSSTITAGGTITSGGHFAMPSGYALTCGGYSCIKGNGSNLVEVGNSDSYLKLIGNVGVGGVTSAKAVLHTTGETWFTNGGGGATAISKSLCSIICGPTSNRSGAAGTYYAGIGFNHMLNYNAAGSYDYTLHAWIGLKLYDTPGSERSSLVFATKSGVNQEMPVERVSIDPFGNLVGTAEITAGSDLRWKKNVKAIGNSIDTIMKLQPCEWDWIERKGGKHCAGLVAQDVQFVLPYAVMDSVDNEFGKAYTLNYNIFHAFEISAIQNHEERIKTLERENAELRRTLQRITT